MGPLRIAAVVHAPPSVVWALLATPDRWPEWGPSIRSVECADPEIRPGTRGRLRPALGPSVPFEITRVEPGRSWHWRVGGIRATGHRLEPVDDGASTRVVFEVPRWGAPYALVCRRALARLAVRVAAAG